jgi:OFA family oxalate/formate antiporter-like MFS transporter
MYTAKGTAAIVVPLASVWATHAGGWHAVFIASATANFLAAALALVALKPLRVKYAERAAPPARMDGGVKATA